MGGALSLISFIIPCYKQAKYVSTAVASVLRQASVGVEAIVIDDGSPDDPSGSLGNLLCDSRVRYVRQENAGLAAARNRGIEESRGDYLNFLDADDWLDERFAIELSRVLRDDPSLGFAYCDMRHVFEQGALDASREDYSVGASRRNTSGDILSSLLLGGYFSPNCVLVPKSVLDVVGGFDVDLGGHADWDLWLRIAVRGMPAKYVDRPLAFYRIHDSNMSRDGEHMRKTQLGGLQKLFRAFPERCAAGIQELIRNLDEVHRVNQRLCREFVTMDNEHAALQRLRGEDQSNNESIFREQRAWIATLEEAKNWHQAQSQHWETETQRLLALYEDQRQWIEQLTLQKQELEHQLEAARKTPDGTSQK